PAHTAIKLILDNHSAHISKETKAWLADQPAHRFEFTFTPKHGSWLTLVEGFFSKLARPVLRHIRVASKQELKDRIMAAMDYFNQEPVVHTWAYKLNKAAHHNSNFENPGLVTLPFTQILASTSRTDAANQLLPLAVGIPRSLRALAMARSDLAPLACSSAITVNRHWNGTPDRRPKGTPL